MCDVCSASRVTCNDCLICVVISQGIPTRMLFLVRQFNLFKRARLVGFCVSIWVVVGGVTVFMGVAGWVYGWSHISQAWE